MVVIAFLADLPLVAEVAFKRAKTCLLSIVEPGKPLMSLLKKVKCLLFNDNLVLKLSTQLQKYGLCYLALQRVLAGEEGLFLLQSKLSTVNVSCCLRIVFVWY